MKKLLLIAIVCIACTSFAQSPTTWTQYYQSNGITISYKYADCDLEMGFDEQRVLIKIENSTDQKAHVIWDAHQYYNEECRTCEDPYGEYRREFSIEPGLTIEGKCSVYSDNRLVVFSKWVSQPNKTTLTKFELSNLIVELL